MFWTNWLFLTIELPGLDGMFLLKYVDINTITLTTLLTASTQPGQPLSKRRRLLKTPLPSTLKSFRKLSGRISREPFAFYNHSGLSSLPRLGSGPPQTWWRSCGLPSSSTIWLWRMVSATWPIRFLYHQGPLSFNQEASLTPSARKIYDLLNSNREHNIKGLPTTW
jgi:hypothetical protein